MKKVTVIIPYKEDRGWLKEAIDSVPSDVELILSKGDGNWPQNFNKALGQATGDYIKYLHDDDILAPHSISTCVHYLEQTGFDFVHGKAVEFYDDRSTRNIYTPAVKFPLLNDLLCKNVIHSCTTMYRREIFEKIGGFNEDPKMYSFEEFEFNLRVLKEGFKIGYIDKVLAYYRRHSRQIIRTVDKDIRNINRKALIKTYSV